MSKTRHMQKRMTQRGIKHGMIEIVKEFGVDCGDKVYLNRKGIDALLKELTYISKLAQKMHSRGGIVLIESNGAEITTYALDSFNRVK